MRAATRDSAVGKGNENDAEFYGQEKLKMVKAMRVNQKSTSDVIGKGPVGGNRLGRWQSARACGRSIGDTSEWDRNSQRASSFPAKGSLLVIALSITFSFNFQDLTVVHPTGESS